MISMILVALTLTQAPPPEIRILFSGSSCSAGVALAPPAEAIIRAEPGADETAQEPLDAATCQKISAAAQKAVKTRKVQLDQAVKRHADRIKKR